ncbi:ABC transporter permease [Niabella drilacis]|uniref:ABC-type antimicrobial peptide transport system, permease component n=1 Tax=Niabella drilacis (strain DSM 25811 / CCM 8410 / CCUG 62505 / LMG 26954 / E90) TaxID=1285928 RepID=A0A1G7AI14_NIADE|nr:ABC transporter permease [Niabella drilacis]SDE14578.1 ABC-type antimicrobial peptide transport system, permease component [Niabella drilacis]
MLKNYFAVAWRNLQRNKLYSFVNISGLAIGISVAMLISFWVWDELHFDAYHANHQRLAQLMRTYRSNDGTLVTEQASCIPVADALRNKFGSNFSNVAAASWNFGHVLAAGDKKIAAKGLWTEAAFPVMFSFKMRSGRIGALDDPSAVLLSASLAQRLFGSSDPIGKTIRFDNKNDFRVAGVYEDLPPNTTFYETKLLLPWKKYITTEEWLRKAVADWDEQSFQVFAALAEGADVETVSGKIENVVMTHKRVKQEWEQAQLFPMDRWHLYGEFKGGRSVGGGIRFVYLFSVIGVFVLLLAGINFVNLSTARSTQRAKEVGIRKTVGSGRGRLIWQFLTESVLTTFLSFLLAVLLVLLAMPLFNELSGKQLLFPWHSLAFWCAALGFMILTGFLSGIYPAFYLSGFIPVKVLKGTFRAGKTAGSPRKVLVVLQFSFSIALVIGSVIVFKQIRYAKDRPVNYRKEGLITVQMNTPDLYGHYDALRNELLATGTVTNMAESSSPTIDVFSSSSRFEWRGKDPAGSPVFGIIGVTTDFGNTIGWEIKKGRDFSGAFSTDTAAVILNEAAAMQMGAAGAVGGEIRHNGKAYTVIGVVKDMVMTSPYAPPVPTVFLNDPEWANVVTIAIKKGVSLQYALDKIEQVFKKYNPDAPFDFAFNDEIYARKFAGEQRIGRLSVLFTALAIFISCLGILGLASFVAEQRKKEISLRKVLGAGVYQLWRLLSVEFLLLVLIACFVAIPLAWYYLHQWLQQYAYRTELSFGVFLLSGAGALVLTLLTVSIQALKAALMNPVKALRSE